MTTKLQGNDLDQRTLALKAAAHVQTTLEAAHRQILRARGVNPELYRDSRLVEIDTLFCQFVAAFDSMELESGQ